MASSRIVDFGIELLEAAKKSYIFQPMQVSGIVI
jgi:hypothetical protein